MKKKAKYLMILILLFAVNVGVRGAVRIYDSNMCRKLQAAVISNDVEFLNSKEDSERIFKTENRSYDENTKELNIYVKDFEPGAIRLSGELKQGNHALPFELYGGFDKPQTLIVDGKQTQGDYVGEFYNGIHIDLSSTKYTILNAECLLVIE